MDNGKRERAGKGRNRDITPAFESLAILDQAKKVPDSRVTIPSPAAVADAKNWVDTNEK